MGYFEADWNPGTARFLILGMLIQVLPTAVFYIAEMFMNIRFSNKGFGEITSRKKNSNPQITKKTKGNAVEKPSLDAPAIDQVPNTDRPSTNRSILDKGEDTLKFDSFKETQFKKIVQGVG